jgi:tRNA nucleotidyltransferase/poly(A) polymerase
VIHPASIQEDLRRRDFTVNAMAISLNEGSFGLLMDPMNGAADIESRTLRLVSNYGFLEEPSLLIRATRYLSRLGWELDPKTRTRYENARLEGVIEFLSDEARSRELEQIGHEEDGLKVLRALEADGWMEALYPAWTAAKANEEGLKALQDLAVELLLQGVHADISAAQMQLLTARLSNKELTGLKKLMLRPGFAEEWSSLDALAAGFAKVLLSKANATPSEGFKLFQSYDPEAILWLGFTSKDAAVQERFNLFLKVWPEARQRLPHALMQEMRITPELPAYQEIVQSVFLKLIDGKLTTPEEIRVFLEPHSPPAPPPKEVIKRPRAKRGEAKIKEDSFDDEDEAEEGLDEDLDDIGGDDEEIDLGLTLPVVGLDVDAGEETEPAEDELEAGEDEPPPVAEKPTARKAAKAETAKQTAPAAAETAPVKMQETVAKPIAAKPEKAVKPQLAEPAPKAEVKHTVQEKAGVAKKGPQAPAAKGKAAPPVVKAKVAVPAKKASPAPATVKGGKAAKHVAVKTPAKAPAKPVAKPAPTKAKAAPPASKPSKAAAKGSKPAAKKPVAKPAKKR